MRIAVIDYELCDPEVCGYFLCKRLCPVNRKGEECIKIQQRTEQEKTSGKKKEYPVIDEELCIGCGICAKKCPRKAISIINTPEELKELPIHRFGQNEFVLFRLPVPIKGVVGLLGANGTGKSTALKILSGKLKPNLGKVSVGKEKSSEGEETNNRPPLTSDSSWDNIIKIHRGTELQNYLEKLSSDSITAIIKPQHVGLLPKVFKGKASDLLKDIEPKLVEKLHLKNCMNREVDNLSGGELQKVAIAAAMSKDVDFYFFDEPSSYLDVSERLNMAKVIRELAQEKNVMVVEHDLATLDFLADSIHIFYGNPGVFGVVSKPYAIRKGINAFLNGFIREDNIRIRDPTTFEEVTYDQAERKNILVRFDNIIKDFVDFKLTIDHGEIYRNEVLGIFGSNALGKTTFAKILAGEIKPDHGSVNEKLKISFKPQYITSEYEGTVSELLATVNNSDFRNQIIMSLGLEKIMEKQVKNLSGGELQKVAIALCLGKDADLYLMDEPSAYLDVDQRLIVAKLLKNKASNKTCAIIDHDLLFLSYLSHRSMLFSGESGKYGKAACMPLKQGFNEFLKTLGISFRRDEETKRPRANKPGSVKDREQKEKGEYFYS